MLLMARLVLDLKKSIEENASDYFEKAKKIKKKIKGAEEALQKSLKKLKELEAKKEKLSAEEEQKSKAKERKKEWYEKFRWFTSSDGFLVLGGRDATSNEIAIKKHTDENDLVLHTDMAGSPFFVIKSKGKKIPESTIKESADAVCTFSKTWKLGLQTSDVFYVKPEQVSKKTKAGEYMGKGAFMIYGKTNYIENKVNLAVGITKENAIMSGPVEAIKKNCKKYIILKQGNEKVSSIAKKISYKLGGNLDIDEIIRALPAGTFSFQ
jgi:predicted ribosome quality control (RQC) complex YloA/Tae2 family protein|tara:strand:+ start:1051 stop:1848 length:798 start_codon:yes stop_codon:yes gene_type:complete